MGRNAEEESLRMEAEKRMGEVIKENESLAHWKVTHRLTNVITLH